MQRANSLEKTLMLGKVEGRRRRKQQRMRRLTASPAQQTWVCTDSRRRFSPWSRKELDTTEWLNKCLSLCDLTPHNARKAHPCCHKGQDFHFYSWIIFLLSHNIYNTHNYEIYNNNTPHTFFIHSSVNEHVGCHPNLAIESSTATNMEGQIPLRDNNCISYGYTFRNGLLSCMIALFLIFWETSTLFSIVVVQIPTNSTHFPFLCTLVRFI